VGYAPQAAVFVGLEWPRLWCGRPGRRREPGAVIIWDYVGNDGMSDAGYEIADVFVP